MAEQVSPHDLILSSRVTGASVVNSAGDRIGHVEDLSIHKLSGEVIYAILAFGGFLGIGERWHPVPWALLDYHADKGGYVLPLEKSDLQNAPSLSREELEELGAGDLWRARLFDYYGPFGAVPYV
jgi:hypothetical protein